MGVYNMRIGWWLVKDGGRCWKIGNFWPLSINPSMYCVKTIVALRRPIIPCEPRERNIPPMPSQSFILLVVVTGRPQIYRGRALSTQYATQRGNDLTGGSALSLNRDIMGIPRVVFGRQG
ncbi:uncharacterized protein CLUP02_03823 [Colletotrichum lupini]|uniref:Uncharacterized protein n=1 Tax=Colletotrichum lupini TaxID=145971 RepID=A0A9Q8SJ79_9PEZI|nr:uncharacterized protein CLUP02_03823 [Colletotrichum lupini]UQC78346.1 hypothetical protein CLUP02_03823 [Colletotrichum lupini]